MAKTYKQRIHEELNKLADKFPNATLVDMTIALDAFAGEIWHALPKPVTEGRKYKLKDRTARYRLA